MQSVICILMSSKRRELYINMFELTVKERSNILVVKCIYSVIYKKWNQNYFSLIEIIH